MLSSRWRYFLIIKVPFEGHFSKVLQPIHFCSETLHFISGSFLHNKMSGIRRCSVLNPAQIFLRSVLVNHFFIKLSAFLVFWLLSIRKKAFRRI